MNSRERTLLALNHEQPDRIPIDFWISAGFREKLRATLNGSIESFMDDHDVDLRYIEGPAYIGPALRTFPDGTEEDIWGVRRKAVAVRIGEAVESYMEVTESPLTHAETVDQIDSYDHWPRADWFDYSNIEKQCDRIRNQGRPVVFMGDRLNRIAQLKPAMYLRGTEQIFMDMTLNPEMAKAILGHIRRFYRDYAERIFEAAKGKLDILLTGDDFGSQNGPLISPAMWTEYLGCGFAEYIDIAKGYNLRVMHHTCGSVRPIIPLMIERGLDVLQSLQPEAADMAPQALKDEFGERLAFHGGISIQKTLPFGSADDVRRQVKSRIKALGTGGGYILCTSHNIQADTPIENVHALLEAYHDYGRYS